MRPKIQVAVWGVGAVLLFLGLAQAKSVWRKVQTPFQGQINGVAMSPDGRHIILSGGFTLHSSDRGVTWEQVSSAPEIMTFGDNTHLFGVGSSQGCNLPNGIAGMLRSTDYGKTWLGTSVRVPMCFTDIFFLDSLHGWAGGYGKDSILVTKDGGKTLTAYSYGISNFGVGGISFLDTLRGWVGGSRILGSTDGGINWSQYSPITVWSIDFVDTLHGWLLRSDVNGKQHIHTSSDGGQSWTEYSTPVHQEIRQIEAVDSLECWAIGVSVFPFSPRIWRTTNGSQSWITEYAGPGGFLLDFDMADSAHGVAVGNLGTVLIYAPLILGDLNADEQITLVDVMFEINKTFLGLPFFSPEEAGDVNCDGLFTGSDVVLLLNRFYLNIPFPCSV